MKKRNVKILLKIMFYGIFFYWAVKNSIIKTAISILVKISLTEKNILVKVNVNCN